MTGWPEGIPCVCGHLPPCAHTPFAGQPTRRDDNAELAAAHLYDRRRRAEKLRAEHHNQPHRKAA